MGTPRTQPHAQTIQRDTTNRQTGPRKLQSPTGFKRKPWRLPSLHRILLCTQRRTKWCGRPSLFSGALSIHARRTSGGSGQRRVTRCARRARRLLSDNRRWKCPKENGKSATCNARTRTARLILITGRLVEVPHVVVDRGVVVRPPIVEVSVTIKIKGSLHTVMHASWLGYGEEYTSIPFWSGKSRKCRTSASGCTKDASRSEEDPHNSSNRSASNTFPNSRRPNDVVLVHAVLCCLRPTEIVVPIRVFKQPASTPSTHKKVIGKPCIA